MFYPAVLTEDPAGGFVVSFRDIPEALTQGDDEKEALEMAEDALINALDFYFDDQRPVPLPSKAKRGERLVGLPLSIAAKVLLLNEMLAQNIRPADLARRMNVLPQEVNRLLSLDHKTKIDTVALALLSLGRRFELTVA
jgi:antitoxin HicB